MSNIILNNSLFWRYKGRNEMSWYLCGDTSSDDMRAAHVDWCRRYSCNAVLICLNNERCMSLFRNGYGNDLDMAKVNMTVGYIRALHGAGAKVVIAFFDGPAEPGQKYNPMVERKDVHPRFIEAACRTLNPYVAAYVIGCETNRYFSTEETEAAIAITKRNCGLIPVGTHEQFIRPDGDGWKATRTFPRNADFCCYETYNHPQDGDKRTVASLVSEIKYLVSLVNMPVWVCEWNLNPAGYTSVEQARAMVEVPGVVGIGGRLM